MSGEEGKPHYLKLRTGSIFTVYLQQRLTYAWQKINMANSLAFKTFIVMTQASYILLCCPEEANVVRRSYLTESMKMGWDNVDKDTETKFQRHCVLREY